MPTAKLELLLVFVVIRMEEMRGGLLRPPTTGAAAMGPFGRVKEVTEPKERVVLLSRGSNVAEEGRKRALELNLIDAVGRGSRSCVIAELLALFFALH